MPPDRTNDQGAVALYGYRGLSTQQKESFMDTIVERQEQFVPDEPYLAGNGEIELFSFGSCSDPVYYKREGDLMVNVPLNQMLH